MLGGLPAALARDDISTCIRCKVSAQEAAHEVCDEFPILLESKVSGVQKVELDVFQIALVGVGAGSRKDLILLTPDDQRRRLHLTHPGLPGRIQRRVAAVVVE